MKFIDCTYKTVSVNGTDYYNHVVNLDQVTSFNKVKTDKEVHCIRFFFDYRNTLLWVFLDQADRDLEYKKVLHIATKEPNNVQSKTASPIRIV